MRRVPELPFSPEKTNGARHTRNRSHRYCCDQSNGVAEQRSPTNRQSIHASPTRSTTHTHSPKTNGRPLKNTQTHTHTHTHTHTQVYTPVQIQVNSAKHSLLLVAQDQLPHPPPASPPCRPVLLRFDRNLPGGSGQEKKCRGRASPTVACFPTYDDDDSSLRRVLKMEHRPPRAARSKISSSVTHTLARQPASLFFALLCVFFLPDIYPRIYQSGGGSSKLVNLGVNNIDALFRRPPVCRTGSSERGQGRPKTQQTTQHKTRVAIWGPSVLVSRSRGAASKYLSMTKRRGTRGSRQAARC